MKSLESDSRSTRILHVDENRTDSERLQKLVKMFYPSVSFISASTTEEARDAMLNFLPNVIFSEVSSSTENYLDYYILNGCIGKTPLVIASETPNHAPSAFKLQAVHYIEKPLRAEDVKEALLRAADRLKSSISSHEHEPASLMINTEKFTSFLNLNEVVLLMADGTYTHIRQRCGKTTVVSKNLGSFENKLPDHFVRINKSVIINIGFVEHIRRDNTVEMKNCPSVGISYRRKSEVMDRIKKYFIRHNHPQLGMI